MVRIESNANFLSRFFADKARITPVIFCEHGVLHAHALLVWGKCSRRFSELHTGLFSLFFRWKHLRIHRSSFQ